MKLQSITPNQYQRHDEHPWHCRASCRGEQANAPSSQRSITLHPLISPHSLIPQNSQSQRVLWLLEELCIPYNLVLHSRNPKTVRAPPELAKIHPLGKSPILVISSGIPIVESSAIVSYLLRTYDTSGRFSSQDWVRDETLTSFAGATLGPITTVELIFDLAAQKTPWPLKYIPGAIYKAMHNNFTGPEFKKALTFLEGELDGSDWFNGKELGRSDVMLSWPLDMIAQANWVDLEREYPAIYAWRKRVSWRLLISILWYSFVARRS